MGSITLAVMFDTEEQKKATHDALRVLLVNQFIDRLLEGDFGVLGGRKPRLVQAQQMLKLLDVNKDSVLSPSERQPAIGFVQASGFMKRFGAIGFE